MYLSADEYAVFGAAVHLLEPALPGDLLLLEGGQLRLQTALHVRRRRAAARLTAPYALLDAS